MMILIYMFLLYLTCGYDVHIEIITNTQTFLYTSLRCANDLCAAL